MTGPEHYREAERLLADVGEERYRQSEYAQWLGPVGAVAAAQVHATLALAAATALGREGEGRTMAAKDRAAWFDVAAECRKAQS